MSDVPARARVAVVSREFDPDRLPPPVRVVFEKWCSLGGESLVLGFHREAAGFLARSRANGADDDDIRAYLGGSAQDHAAEWGMAHPDPGDDPATRGEFLEIVRGVIDQVLADHPA
jgi:hypothetical protein